MKSINHKVYCKNCEWWNSNINLNCLQTKKVVPDNIDTFYEPPKLKEIFLEPYKENKDNNCEFYTDKNSKTQNEKEKIERCVIWAFCKYCDNGSISCKDKNNKILIEKFNEWIKNENI